MSCEQRGSARSKWRCSVTGAMLLGLPLSLLGLATCLGRRGTPSSPGLCSTVSCRTAALALNLSLSRSVGPCDDMQHFVCDGWPHMERASSRVQMIMNYALSAYVVPHHGQSAVDKVVALYQSCVAGLSPGGDGGALRSLLVHLGLTPNSAAVGSTFRAILRLSVRHGLHLLLAIRFNGSTINLRPVRPSVPQSNPGYVRRVAELALLDDPRAVAHDLLLIDRELDAVTAIVRADQPTRTVHMEVLAEETGSLSDWLTQLPGTNSHTPTVVQMPFTVRGFANFLRRHRGDPALRRYVAWHTARVLGSLTQYDLFRATLENTLGYMEPSPGLVKTTCLAQAANLMPLAYNAFVVRHFATRRSRRAVESIAEGLRAAAAVQVRASRWMTDRPKAMAKLKLRKLTWLLPRQRSERQVNRHYSRLGNMGVNDSLQAYLAATEHNSHTPDPPEANQAAVDVVYTAHKNTILVSAGILNTPFFEDTLPAAFNYAGLGQRMAIELLHVLDEQGSWHDERGRHRNWWDESTSENYRTRMQCPRAGGGRAVLEGSALRLAYQAFQRTHQHVLLKGLERFTPDQIFFISSCHKWCGQEGSPCNSVMKSLKEFAAAFKCQPDEPMNPSERCELLV